MKRLEKSRSNRVISGVLGGIGEYFNIDPTIVRIIFIILTVFGVGSPFLIYIVLAIVMPEAPRKNNEWNGYQGGNPYSNHDFGNTKKEPKRKEAEKVDDNDWSDF